MAQTVTLSLSDNCCPWTERVIHMRKAQLQNEAELEKVKKKRRLDFLDILLFAQVSRNTGLTVVQRHKRRGKLYYPILPSSRQRMGKACLMRTYVQRWAHSCLRVLTLQPVESPGFSTLWPPTLSTNRDAEKRCRVSWVMEPLSHGENNSR